MGVEEGDEAVVWQVLVQHQHVVVAERVGLYPALVAGRIGHGGEGARFEGVEEADAEVVAVAPADFGGIDELRLHGVVYDVLPFAELAGHAAIEHRAVANAPGVEHVALVEQLGALGEELPVLIEAHLEGGEVQYLIIKNHLAEIGHQGHVQREGVIDAVLEVGPEIVWGGQLEVAIGRVAGGIQVAAHVGEEEQAQGRVDIADAIEHARLVDEALHVRVNRVPPRIFAVAPDAAHEVDAPALFLHLREADGGVGDAQFHSPAAVANRCVHSAKQPYHWPHLGPAPIFSHRAAHRPPSR
jgi:hypothetical protein